MNILENSMMRKMYESAMMNLSNGVVSGIDRMVLSDFPLPENFIEPYTSQEVPDVQTSMRMTFEAMTIWIEAAKETNYFSKRFVQLSRMIMNGVTTMGRGLITLHDRGENFDNAPMSIQDLIGVASYHFRKSYLGVLQTAKSHPEISERLLMNQFGWNNILLRLYKTREKLALPVPEARKKCLDSGKNSECRLRDPEGNSRTEAGDVISLPASKNRGAFSVSAYSEPGAIAAPRAFSSYDRSGRVKTASLSLTDGSEQQIPEAGGSDPDEKEKNRKHRTPLDQINSEKENQKKDEENQEPEKRKADEVHKTIEKDMTENRTSEATKAGEYQEQDGKEKSENGQSGSKKTESDQEQNEAGASEERSSDNITGVKSNLSDQKTMKPSVDDLTENEKEIYSSALRWNDYLWRMQRNIKDPAFWQKAPKLAESYVKVLAILDSS